jgi:hypothetical protein
MRHAAPGFFDRLFHDLARSLGVAHAGGEDPAQRRMRLKTSQLSIGHSALPIVGHGAVEQTGGNDLGAPQGRGALDDERDGNY